MREAILRGSLLLPSELVPDVQKLMKQCTVRYTPMGENDQIEVCAAWTDSEGYLHVPRVFGLAEAQRLGVPVRDETSPGVPVVFPKVPKPRDKQVAYVEDLTDLVLGPGDFIAKAHTGFGKTVTALIAAAEKGVSTLVVVDQENLFLQWTTDTLLNPALFGFSPDDIGKVQGKVCRYQGKAVTVAMLQTLVSREYPQEFLDYFGLVIVDEVHTAGAPTFSTVLGMFSAETRFGISATPKRPDSLQKLIAASLGSVDVEAVAEHSRSAAYVIKNETVYSWYANISPKTGRMISEVTDDGSRNLKIADAIRAMYLRGRTILVLSDRTEHLYELQALCAYSGVPREDMGIYTGEKKEYRYAKDPRPKRRPDGYVRKTEYTPVSLQLISKKTPKKELTAVKENARIIFATYGMFSKGVDEPRIDTGIDASPRSRFQQIHGRILRVVRGKMIPVWITVADTMSYRLMYQLCGRLRELSESNVDFYSWEPGGEAIEWERNDLLLWARERHGMLEGRRIETMSGGRNIVALQT